MNIIYYFLGAFITFIGVIIYGFFQGGGSITINQTSAVEMGMTAAIAGLSFFIADYLMSKARPK